MKKNKKIQYNKAELFIREANGELKHIGQVDSVNVSVEEIDGKNYIGKVVYDLFERTLKSED